MADSDLRWRNGRTVRVSIGDEVVDHDDILHRAAYALLFTRDDRSLGGSLQDELGPLGLDVEVHQAPGRGPDPLAPIVVRITPSPRSSLRTRLERRQPAQADLTQ